MFLSISNVICRPVHMIWLKVAIFSKVRSSKFSFTVLNKLRELWYSVIWLWVHFLHLIKCLSYRTKYQLYKMTTNWVSRWCLRPQGHSECLQLKMEPQGPPWEASKKSTKTWKFFFNLFICFFWHVRRGCVLPFHFD